MPLPAAKLGVTVGVSGPLRLSLITTVHLRVTDTGNAATGDLAATLTLPAGTVFAGLASAGTHPWTCAASSSGANCTHSPIGPDVSAPAVVNVLVISLAGCGSPVVASVVSGGVSATAQSADLTCG